MSVVLQSQSSSYHQPRKQRYKTDLPAQLVECEMNYHRLLRLVGGIKQLAIGESSHYLVGSVVGREDEFRATVLEQTKYTTVVHIAQLFSLQNIPDFIKKSASSQQQPMVYQGDVRLYHDANMAEVVKCQRYYSFAPRYEYPNLDMHQIDEKAQMNRFLGELLSHCLACGRMATDITFGESTRSHP